MPSLPNHERRITILESRVDEVERNYGESIYTITRELAAHSITFRRMAERFNFQYATDEEVDEALDQK